MAGLLDDFSEFIKTPGGQGLLSAAFGGLAGAQRGAPLNSLGRAGLAGLSGYGGALDREKQAAEAAQMGKYREMQQTQMQMQIDAAKRKATEEQGQADWRIGLPAVMNAKVYGAGDEGPTMAPADPSALKNYLMQPNSPFADEVLKNQLFPKAPDYKVVGDSLLQVGANGVNPVYTAPTKPEAAPSAVKEYNFAKDQGYKGSFLDFQLAQKKAGATNVNNTVSMAAPENEYNKVVGKTLADNGTSLVAAAQQAPSIVDNARSIKTALDKGAITGTGAEARLAVQKAAETLGIVEPGKAATTQQLMSGLGKLTLSGIKTSGLGGGNGFTDKDREFLNAAMSGNIADTPENLRRVADLSERVATATHQKGSAVLDRWKKSPSLSAVAQDSQIDPLPAPILQVPKPVANVDDLVGKYRSK